MTDLVQQVTSEEREMSKELMDREIRETAVAATRDTEEVLAELHTVAEQRRALEQRYQELSAEATAQLEDGPRYFVGEDGAKHYAVRNQQRPVEVDLEELIRLIENDPELLEKLAPRKVDKTAFRHAVLAGHISPEELVRVARLTSKRPFVRFHTYDAQ